MTKIQIKKLSASVSIPKYETLGSSGMDIAAHLENKIIIAIMSFLKSNLYIFYWILLIIYLALLKYNAYIFSIVPSIWVTTAYDEG